MSRVFVLSLFKRVTIFVFSLLSAWLPFLSLSPLSSFKWLGFLSSLESLLFKWLVFAFSLFSKWVGFLVFPPLQMCSSINSYLFCLFSPLQLGERLLHLTMSESPEPSVFDPVAVDSVPEKVQDSPAFSTASCETTATSPAKVRLFNRQRSIHEILGGGKHADVLLWRHRFMSAGIVVGSTVAWLIFEKSGYTLLTILGNTLLILIVALFIWSNGAALLNRSLPPLPELELSEEMVLRFASAMREQINKALTVAHDVALGKDFKLFLKVVAMLWGLSMVGGWFHLLTLAYILVIVAHTLPALYDSYEDHVDHYAKIALDQAHKQYRKIDAVVLSKISKGFPSKEKKAH